MTLPSVLSKGKHFNLTLESIINKRGSYTLAMHLISPSHLKLRLPNLLICVTAGSRPRIKNKHGDLKKARSGNKKGLVEIILSGGSLMYKTEKC